MFLGEYSNIYGFYKFESDLNRICKWKKDSMNRGMARWAAAGEPQFGVQQRAHQGAGYVPDNILQAKTC
jgi:hypothetical protein